VKRCSVVAEVQWCWCWCKGAEMEVLRCCLQRFFSRCGFAGDSCCAGAEDLQWFSRGSAEVQQRCRGTVLQSEVQRCRCMRCRCMRCRCMRCRAGAEVLLQRCRDDAEYVRRFCRGVCAER
jgi:hypothetical protein